MNIYELFGLVLVIGMVTMLLLAARAMGDHERTMRRPRRPSTPAKERENSEA